LSPGGASVLSKSEGLLHAITKNPYIAVNAALVAVVFKWVECPPIAVPPEKLIRVYLVVDEADRAIDLQCDDPRPRSDGSADCRRNRPAGAVPLMLDVPCDARLDGRVRRYSVLPVPCGVELHGR
jgi:hypothetical protein